MGVESDVQMNCLPIAIIVSDYLESQIPVGTEVWIP